MNVTTVLGETTASDRASRSTRLIEHRLFLKIHACLSCIERGQQSGQLVWYRVCLIQVYTSCSTNCNAPGAISRVTTSLWNLVKASDADAASDVQHLMLPGTPPSGQNNVNNIAIGPRFHASFSHTFSLSFMFRVCVPVVMWLCPLRVTFMTVIDCTSLLFFVCVSCSWCHSVTLLLFLSHSSCQCGYSFPSLSLIHNHHVTLVFLYLHHVCQGSLIVRTWLQFPLSVSLLLAPSHVRVIMMYICTVGGKNVL